MVITKTGWHKFCWGSRDGSGQIATLNNSKALMKDGYRGHDESRNPLERRRNAGRMLAREHGRNQEKLLRKAGGTE